jgi:hypothetical protein
MEHAKRELTEHVLRIWNDQSVFFNSCNKCIKLHAIKTLFSGSSILLYNNWGSRMNENLNTVLEYILTWYISVCLGLNYKYHCSTSTQPFPVKNDEVQWLALLSNLVTDVLSVEPVFTFLSLVVLYCYCIQDDCYFGHTEETLSGGNCSLCVIHLKSGCDVNCC